MSEIKTTRVWNGLPVDQYTNITTGESKIYSQGSGSLFGLGGRLLATSKPENGETKWVYNNQEQFRRSYNIEQRNKGSKELTQKEFNKKFRTEGYKYFDIDRARILNKESSISEKISFSENKVPLITNPISKKTVNSDGTVPEEQTITQDPNANGGGDDPPALGAGEGNDVVTTSGGGTNSGTNDTTGGTVSGNGNGNQSAPGEGDDESGDGKESGVELANKLTIDDKTNAGGEEGVILRYPSIDPPKELAMDYIQITAYDYKPSGIDFNNDPLKNRGKAYETVQLPMQPSLSETRSENWGTDQFDAIKREFASLSQGLIEGGSTLDMTRIRSVVEGTAENVKGALNDPAVKQMITAYFAGAAVGGNVIARQSGAIINPNLEVLFNGPGIRSFNFNFRLTPRSVEESKVIRKIIRAFKRNSSVQRTSSSFYLLSPRIFQIEYVYKGRSQHPYLNKFKLCAMTGFNVNYTPDGSYMVYGETGSLTAFDITMSFTELSPNYADEYNDINEQNMGY